MIIAGLQKLSLVDYPGYLAATVFVKGCNFRCGYCHNPDLIDPDPKDSLDEDEVIRAIEKRRDMIEAVVITGGEPTIYKDLRDFIIKIKDKGFKVKLDTNGFDPACIEALLREYLLDYVAVDIKTTFDKYHLVTDVKDIKKHISETVHLVMLSTVPYEFRTTCVPGIVDEQDIKEIAKEVKGAAKFCLQQFRPMKTYDEAFQNVKPHDIKDLERFKDILNEQVKEVEIRGI